MSDETGNGFTYFAESLMHLLVRANWKDACRKLWPDVSRFRFVEFRPRYTWQYCLPFNDQGYYGEVQPPTRKEWSDLVYEARSNRCDSAPQPVVERPLLHALYVLLFPYRATPDVVRHLSHVFNRAWLIPPPRTE